MGGVSGEGRATRPFYFFATRRQFFLFHPRPADDECDIPLQQRSIDGTRRTAVTSRVIEIIAEDEIVVVAQGDFDVWMRRGGVAHLKKGGVEFLPVVEKLCTA